MSDIAREIHDIIQKWAQRGYIIPEVATDIEDDIQGAIRPFPELERTASATRAVDLGMRCFMQEHEQRLGRVRQVAQEALDWADSATLDPDRVLRIVEGRE